VWASIRRREDARGVVVGAILAASKVIVKRLPFHAVACPTMAAVFSSAAVPLVMPTVIGIRHFLSMASCFPATAAESARTLAWRTADGHSL
jgi:hypothetical protein